MHFSSGWLHKFKERNGIQLRKLHGEAGSSDQNAIIENLPPLREKLSRFGLFYQLEPDRSLATTRLSGRKKNKERLSIALCANAWMLTTLFREWLSDFLIFTFHS